MLLQPLTPFLYEVVEPTTEQTTVLDVVFGSLAVAGAVAAVALVLGLACAAVMIGIRRMRGRDDLGGGRSQGVRLGLGG